MEISVPRTQTWEMARRNELFRETGLIAFVSLLSTVLYVGRLGFYTDDWHFIGSLFLHAPDRSYVGLLWQLTDSNMLTRPVQLVYLTTLYYFFGLNPLAYHIVNALSMAVIGVLFHLVIRELRFPARFALAISLIYVLLPHASANRFWYALFQANLSLLFFCLSLYADLRLLRAQAGRHIGWQILSVTGLLMSTLAYELVIPLFALVPLLVWYQRRRLVAGEASTGPRIYLVLLTRNWLLLVAIIIFKAYTTNRIPQNQNLIERITWFANLQLDAFKMVFLGPYGIRLPRMLQRIAFEYFDPVALTLSLAVGALVFASIYWWPRYNEEPLPNIRVLLILVAVAICCIAAGYGMFAIAPLARIASTGINNRSSGAALFGIAIFVAAGAGILASLLRNEHRTRLVFALIIAFYSSSSFLAVNTLGNFWAAASQEQQQIMAEVRDRFPTLAPGSSVILDGYCPYIGPGIVFETAWDITGMLNLMYNDPTLQGDVVNRRVEIREDGLYMNLYSQNAIRTPETEEAARNGQLRRLAVVSFYVHPYGKMWIYNRKHNVVVPIPDATAANAYFARYNPIKKNDCGNYNYGNGISVW